MRTYVILAAVCSVASVGLMVVAAAPRPEYQHNHFKKMEDRCVEKKATNKEDCLRALSAWYNGDFKDKEPADGTLKRFKTTLENFVKLGEFNVASSCTRGYQRLLKSTANVVGWDLDADNKNAVAKFPTVFAIWSSFNKKFRVDCPSIRS